MSEKVVISVKELASVLGVSRTIAYNLVHTEGFPTLRIGGRRILIPIQGLQVWLEANTTKG